MTVDSGAEQCNVPRALEDQLRLGTFASLRVSGVDRVVTEDASVVPSLALGELVLANVPVLLSRSEPSGRGLVGQSLLRQSQWQVAWDRGTLTLGAAPWSEEQTIASMPLHRFEEHNVDRVEVRLNGRAVSFLFDTGAALSAIPEDLAASLGLPSHSIAPSSMGSAGGAVSVERVFTADLELGSLKVSRQYFAALRAGSIPLLGLDILSHFDLHVVPGKRILLRSRGDLRSTAAARTQRWPLLAHCASPACVRSAHIEPNGTDGKLELELEGPLTTPLQVLFECADPSTPAQPLRSTGELVMAGRLPLPLRHLRVSVNATQQSHLMVKVPFASAFWFAGGANCRDLGVLDAFPLSANEQPSAPASARPAF
ncbi:MAG: aspartyl protease family protein [Myxococcales bacterium]